MNLRQCDHCGQQDTDFDTNWYRLTEPAGAVEPTFGIVPIKYAGERHDFCSWKCVYEFAQLKVREQEMSS